MIYLIIVIVTLIIVAIILIPFNHTYSNEEWEAQLKNDFKKYGPVPEED